MLVQEKVCEQLRWRICDRLLVQGGNFFKSVPSNGDAYLLKHIIHDWDDQQALIILQNCHQAMNYQSKLLIVDRVIPSGNEPMAGKFMDLNMLVLTSGGKERTQAEFSQLLTAAGFEIKQIISTAADISVIEAVPI
ncbi:methyltransferase [Stanieria cyanosphaera]|uniref:methyltransferase n=1 Tax=Stanieria cyanosphaera TaxID=102116 RepID=UPI0002D9F265|nr:methyltransferase [Stanieria cyanosphaera]